MGRRRIAQTAFSNGVLSPRVLGRTDMDKYRHSAEALQNMIVLPQGAIKRRPGSQRVADAMGPSRLIPFVFAPGQAYILELCNDPATGLGAIRFYYATNTAGSWTVGAQLQAAGVPYQLTTPYDSTAISLWDIQYAQQGDVMYFFHPQYPIQKLLRFGSVGLVPGPSDTNWRWLQVTFACPPTDTFDQDISGGTVTLIPGTNASAQDCTVAGAQQIPFVASAAGTFLDGDVGKMIIVGTAVAMITNTTDTDSTGTTAYATILVPFLSTAVIGAGNWLMRGSPSGWASFGKEVANGNPNTGGPAWICTAQYGIGLIEQLSTFKAFPINGTTTLGPATAQTCFRPSDVGRYLNVAGCMALITSYVNAFTVMAQYLSVPEDTFVGSVAGEIRVSPSAPGAWTIEDPIWFGQNGYPGVGGFFQNRLYVAATPFQPKTLWGSQTDNYENFAKGTLEGDGLEFSLAGGKLDSIKWIAGTPVQGLLAIETDATEYVASGGGSGAGGTDGITPTNVHVQANSSQGGCSIPPLLVDAALVYIQRYHTKVFEFAYNIYQSSFSSRDLSLFAEHLTHAGIKEIAYQPIPYKIIWCVTFDGRLLGMTYDKNQDVLAWHEHRTGYADQGYGPVGTGDSYISIASIPNPSPVLLGPNGAPLFSGNGSATYASDLVWTVVQRVRNGATVYTVELMNEDLLVDCSSALPKSAPFSTTQLRDPSLAGRVVVGYGAPLNASKTYFPFDTPFGIKTTADTLGTITTEVKVGSVSGYGLPIQCLLQTIRPEIPEEGTIVGRLQGWVDCSVRVFASRSVVINGDEVINREGFEGYGVASPADSLEPGTLLQGQNLDQTYVAVPQQTMSDEVTPQTVDLRTGNLGSDRYGRILITQDKPFPLTILAFYGILVYGES